jgi:hypothetical protein
VLRLFPGDLPVEVFCSGLLAGYNPKGYLPFHAVNHRRTFVVGRFVVSFFVVFENGDLVGF